MCFSVLKMHVFEISETSVDEFVSETHRRPDGFYIAAEMNVHTNLHKRFVLIRNRQNTHRVNSDNFSTYY